MNEGLPPRGPLILREAVIKRAEFEGQGLCTTWWSPVRINGAIVNYELISRILLGYN